MNTTIDLAILVSGSLRRYRRCRVFDAILDDCWTPRFGRARQAKKIRLFAKRHHWKVQVRTEGLWVVADFEKQLN